jgi:hypothetical protein
MARNRSPSPESVSAFRSIYVPKQRLDAFTPLPLRENIQRGSHENRLGRGRRRLSKSKKGEKKGKIADHGNFI